MTRRSRPSGPRAKRATRAARREELTTFSPPEHDPLSDSRLRPLVERYATLSGATLVELGPHLVELGVPEEDREFFDGRESVLVAFAVTALEHSADAEMAVIGSGFVDQLLSAVRARGALLSLGLVPPDEPAGAEAAAPLGVPVKNGAAGEPVVRVARQRVGRLLARVLVRAGATVEEHLVESGLFELGTRHSALGTRRSGGAECRAPNAEPRALELMVADLRDRLAPRVDELRAEAERALAIELRRIDGYYAALAADAAARGGDASTGGSGAPASTQWDPIEAEHARRRLEEERRHEVRAVVHPLQLVEMEMLVQRAVWTLTASSGRQATLSAQRFLSGPGAWSLSCPACTREPSALVICSDGQVACVSCAQDCSVCGEGFPWGGETAECHVDGEAACDDHARTCSSCRNRHCTAHEGTCAEGEHRACTSCIAPCELCRADVCASHAVTSADAAPRGSRRLCSRCVVHCEGRRSEPVGRDEVVRCESCERFACERHQAACAVDGKVHCSTHLVRADESRRLICEAHRAACDHEPDGVFAADEVRRCASCGKLACAAHGGACGGDGGWHCLVHLAPLQDRPDSLACEQHRTVCHVESAVFAPADTIECPVCARRACSAHARECRSCGRQVCVAEWEEATSRCGTCRRLSPYPTPSPAELAAGTDAGDGDAPRPRKWRAARDATHLVVEMSHGWRRRTVFAMRHGESRAETVMSHARGGATRRR